MHENFHYYRNFTPEDYGRVLKNAACCLGNSSSFIREGAFLGIPAVVVGDRQEGREHSDNVKFVDHQRDKIFDALQEQLSNGRYTPCKMFGDGNASKRMAEQLTQLDLNRKKP